MLKCCITIIKIGFLASIMVGCGTRYHFVVHRDVPPSPTFAVIPANDSMWEALFANEVEHGLISAGVKTLKYYPPQETQVTKESLTGDVESNQDIKAKKGNIASDATLQGGGEKVTVKYSEFSSFSKADYFVETYVSRRHIKISNREGEILALFEALGVNSPLSLLASNETWHERLYHTLFRLGIPLLVEREWNQKGTFTQSPKKTEPMISMPNKVLLGVCGICVIVAILK